MTFHCILWYREGFLTRNRYFFILIDKIHIRFVGYWIFIDPREIPTKIETSRGKKNQPVSLVVLDEKNDWIRPVTHRLDFSKVSFLYSKDLCKFNCSGRFSRSWRSNKRNHSRDCSVAQTLQNWILVKVFARDSIFKDVHL